MPLTVWLVLHMIIIQTSCKCTSTNHTELKWCNFIYMSSLTVNLVSEKTKKKVLEYLNALVYQWSFLSTKHCIKNMPIQKTGFYQTFTLRELYHCWSLFIKRVGKAVMHLIIQHLIFTIQSQWNHEVVLSPKLNFHIVCKQKICMYSNFNKNKNVPKSLFSSVFFSEETMICDHLSLQA